MQAGENSGKLNVDLIFGQMWLKMSMSFWNFWIDLILWILIVMQQFWLDWYPTLWFLNSGGPLQLYSSFDFNQCSIFTECLQVWKRFEYPKSLPVRFPQPDKNLSPTKISHYHQGKSSSHWHCLENSAIGSPHSDSELTKQ